MGRTICLDEIQRVPELFPVLRSVIDEQGTNGQFLILGSASPELLRQSSESLAGRIVYLELTPFLLDEWPARGPGPLPLPFFRGGFPRSLMAGSDEESLTWRESFIRTFLERDISQLGFRIPARTLERLWRMCAHHHGQLLNLSRLGESLGVSHTTIRSYIDLLSETFMLRVLPPLTGNLKKRLVKTPKVYVRDSGVLSALLEVDSRDALFGHPLFGAAWEGFVVETLTALLPRWRASFYRTSNGAELDLVLERGRRRVVVEAKASSAPTVTRGFWNAVKDLEAEQVWIAAPVADSYSLAEGVRVTPLGPLAEHLQALGE